MASGVTDGADRMNALSLDFFVGLETQVWLALVDGDAAADDRLLAPHFHGIYGSGVADKSAHLAQLAGGPTVARFALGDARINELADDIVLLTYLARWTRGRAPLASPVEEKMYVSSIWQRFGAQWLNVFSQDTPVLSA